MSLTPINQMARVTTEFLLFWLFCPNPNCTFDAPLKNLGHPAVRYGEQIKVNCPNCNRMIIKTVGINLGVFEDDYPTHTEDA